MNNLVSRFVPKGADIGKFSHERIERIERIKRIKRIERIKMIEHWIKNYP